MRRVEVGIIVGTRMGNFKGATDVPEAKSALTVEENKSSLEKYMAARRERIAAARDTIKPLR